VEISNDAKHTHDHADATLSDGRAPLLPWLMARRKKSKRNLARWLGLLIVLALLACVPREVPAALLFGLSGAGMLWALFLAPVFCGAPIRKSGGFCRNNSLGLLLGCHLRQHRTRKLTMIFVDHRWQRGLWSSPGAVLATVSAIITIIVPMAQFLRWFVGQWTSGA
jgi:hypothetical protein